MRQVSSANLMHQESTFDPLTTKNGSFATAALTFGINQPTVILLPTARQAVHSGAGVVATPNFLVAIKSIVCAADTTALVDVTHVA